MFKFRGLFHQFQTIIRHGKLQVGAATDGLATRRRGCNCKKSTCLKLYCECFAANGRCSDLCQCVGCKNQDHNRLEIAHAIQAIEKRTQKTFRSPPLVATPSITTAAALSAPAKQTRVVEAPPSSGTPIPVPATFPMERKAAVAMAGTTPRPVCGCRGGVCTSECPCLGLFGACSARCPCKGCQVLPPQDKARGCSCKKSNCLKLYCECLAAQRMCDHRCNCEGCKNRPETLVERERAVAAILDRNPLAFQPKVASGSSQHLRGCNCRKSSCMKNYCECHQAGVACTSRCACHQCRNTETFVSAKKMLVFAGVSADGSAVRGSPGRPGAQRKPARRVARKPPALSGTVGAQQLLQTPTHTSTLRPSALELLSRSAPPASRSYSVTSTRDVPSTPAKRPVSHFEQHYHTTGGAVVTPAFAKRKYTKRSSNRPLFLERIEEAAAEAARLPSVQTAVDSAYRARSSRTQSKTDEPQLVRLSRSLLHAAMVVELGVEEKEAAPAVGGRRAGSSAIDERGDGVKQAEHRRAGDSSDSGGALSPNAAGLFCEEEYSEVAGDEDGRLELTPTSSNGSSHTSQTASASRGPKHGIRPDRRRAMALGVMQERAVLQEFSVWLRNLAAGPHE
ncbi:hypothetical protein BBJ28_00009192 [Nothophytophthora sp. Chile5]|nr:hypothetical protein BBJ28_00009192 [Nothophytophthora sp. Chile5]